MSEVLLGFMVIVFAVVAIIAICKGSGLRIRADKKSVEITVQKDNESKE